MRSDIANANAPVKYSSIRVEVESPGGGFIDLCNPQGSSFPGKSRVQSLSLKYSHDAGKWSADLTLNNHAIYRAAGESLDPGHDSKFNVGGVPLLGAYHEVKIYLGKGGDARLVFQGYCGPGSVESGEDVEGDDTLSISLVGVTHPWTDFYIDEKEGLVYKENYISKNVERDLLNQILHDYGFAEIVVIQDDPNYYCHHYQIGDVNLYEAITKPVHSIGYVLMEKYHAQTDSFRPTVVDPRRTNYTPDVNLGGDIRATRLSYSEADVRTAVRIAYTDRATGKQAYVDAANEEARLKYGVPDGTGGRKHRYMRIVEERGSLIDTRAEAMQMADYALHDLSSPCPSIEAQIPWLALGIEGGDLVQVETPSETILVGVTEISHSLGQGDPIGSTTIRGTLDKRVGARRYWFMRGRMDWVGQHDHAYDEQHGNIPNPPSYIEAAGVWGEGEAGDAVPVLHVRWGGGRAWNMANYVVRYREAELVDFGTATGGSSTTLVDTNKSWPANRWIGCYVQLGGYAYQILKNTSDTLYFTSLGRSVSGGEEYNILRPVGDWTYETTDKYPYHQVKGLKEGSYVIAEVAAAPMSTQR